MINLHSAAIPSDDDLVRWSIDNPGYRFEYFDGKIHIVSPTGGMSGIRNSELHLKIGAWAKANGYRAFGSNTGFVFGDPETLKVSPDEALMKNERFDALSRDDREKLIQIPPDIAAELVSKSQEYGQRRSEVLAKCQAMYDNGVLFVVMLDPYRTVQSERVTTWGAPPPNFPTDWDDVLNA